ncbi:hypothetical protein AQPE_5027 [Aquipluma nitroreducens]|uniref:Uncharacterized protein n=1 Tax=Aquipluma nitroreducens TaxID=2010828 RepID=A0A5K7SH35_9BACT|nr:hypothetical protein AQPE_5027 [Aquipluma nitroreducens]
MSAAVYCKTLSVCSVCFPEFVAISLKIKKLPEFRQLLHRLTTDKSQYSS